MSRFHKTSLAQMPEFRTTGSFGGDEPRLAWHQPGDLWQAQIMLHDGIFTFNGHAIPFRPFDLFIVPPGSRCEVERFGRETFVYDFINFAPVPSDRDVVSLPLHHPLGAEAGNFWDLEFRKGLNRQQFSRTSVQVLAWNLLWAVARPEHVLTKSVYTEQAEKLIDDMIGSKFTVRELCEKLMVSQSQLTRHFMVDHSKTPLQYIRDRRAQLAFRLLSTTTLPIKQVAHHCGVPNVHHFNRFVRERFGGSPREVRKHRGHVDVFRVEDIKKGRGDDTATPA